MTWRTWSAEDVGRQQPELEVLGAAADRGPHLLRVGGGQHEHDVGGRFLERLEQGVLGALAEHVDLVEDDHLAVARGAERHPFEQVAHVVDLALRRGVLLEQPVDDPPVGDGDAVLALAARLAVDRRRAVEDLGEDAGGRRLAGAPRPAEQVGVADPAVAHGVAQRPGDVILAEHLVEPLRSVAAVERLVGGHRGRCYRRGCPPLGEMAPRGSGHSHDDTDAGTQADAQRDCGGVARGEGGGAAGVASTEPRSTVTSGPGRAAPVTGGDGQAVCGTPQAPLRAAASRP